MVTGLIAIRGLAPSPALSFLLIDLHPWSQREEKLDPEVDPKEGHTHSQISRMEQGGVFGAGKANSNGFHLTGFLKKPIVMLRLAAVVSPFNRCSVPPKRV